jgi:hypothetical protein
MQDDHQTEELIKVFIRKVDKKAKSIKIAPKIAAN